MQHRGRRRLDSGAIVHRPLVDVADRVVNAEGLTPRGYAERGMRQSAEAVLGVTDVLAIKLERRLVADGPVRLPMRAGRACACHHP